MNQIWYVRLYWVKNIYNRIIRIFQLDSFRSRDFRVLDHVLHMDSDSQTFLKLAITMKVGVINDMLACIKANHAASNFLLCTPEPSWHQGESHYMEYPCHCQDNSQSVSG